VADLTGALQREKMEIKSGDVVLIHTGWGSWMKDNATFNANSPGICRLRRWLSGRRSWSSAPTTGVLRRSPIPIHLTAPVHQLMLAKNGIYLHENLATEDLARRRLRVRLRLRAAAAQRRTAPGNPIAIR
jgi:kynurenine formamidase